MGRGGMHGNRQNWKGNKGVPEGAPLSLHGGCLATPASRSLFTPPTLLARFILVRSPPSQPFPPNHRCALSSHRSRSLRYPLHFFLLSSLPASPPSVQRNTDALFFSRRAILRPRILASLPPPSFFDRAFSLSLPFSLGDVSPKEPPGFTPLPETTFPHVLPLAAPATLAGMYPRPRRA